MRSSALLSAILFVGLATPACGSTTDDGGSGDTSTPDKAPAGNPQGNDAGGGCKVGGDCKSGICAGGTCTEPTHDDGVKNGSETDVDCGGPGAPVCGDNKGCGAGTDCKSGVCTGNVCQPASGTDGVKNGDESDVDCGGSTTNAARCATDKACTAAEDCASLVCDPAKKTCNAPTGTDGVKNGDESDVDCGGTTTGAPQCAVGKTCNVHADCTTDGCDDQKKCALGRSCTQANGGRTCGSGEVGEAGAQHESCCVALPIPGSATKLDKYKVTAGRMRAFIDRVNGNVKGWYDANKANLSAAAKNQIEPYASYLPITRQGDVRGDGNDWGADFMLGGTIYLTDRPSSLQGCYTGNAQNPAYGSHTFWNGNIEGEDRAFDQAFLDRITLNCIPYPLAAAFCAWDGGRLQTYEENSAAYGPAAYPWGNAPESYGYNTQNGAWTPYGPARIGATVNFCSGCEQNTEQANWLNSYQNPPGGVDAKPWDYAYWISPPGRFPKDKGAGGHMDLGGVGMELTATPGPGDGKYGATVKWSRAGSWEGHQMNNPNWAFAVMTKYGKVGLRCARD